MRILLAYDNSQQSKNALEFASQLPLRKPVDFEIASIVAPPVFVDSMVTGFPLDLGPFIDAETSEARTEVDEVGAKLERRDHVHSVHGRVVVGPPTSRLLDIAEQCKADLVVLGAVGHSAVQRVLLGSVSDYVATHSDTSTLVVRPSGEASFDPEVQKIMLALSGRPEDARMLTWLRELKLRPNVEVHLVRVLDSFKHYRQDFKQKASESWDRQSELAQSQILDFEGELQKLGLNTESHLVQNDHVGDALVNYSDCHGIDLIMTGDSDSGLMTRIFLGSTSRYVLRHARCSVLIARSREDRAKVRLQVAEKQLNVDEVEQQAATGVS